MRVIYDSEGKIFFQATGHIQVPVGELKTMEFEVPAGQVFKGMDVATDTPIFEPLPKTELELIREELALAKEMATVAVEAIASMNEEMSV